MKHIILMQNKSPISVAVLTLKLLSVFSSDMRSNGSMNNAQHVGQLGFDYRYMEFLFTAISRQALGPSDLFSCMKLNTYLSLVPRISGWNSKDSGLWDITP